MDGGLHPRVEILYADAEPIEPHVAERLDTGRVEVAWIGLDTHFHLGCNVEMDAQSGDDGRELGRGEKSRTAAPKWIWMTGPGASSICA